MARFGSVDRRWLDGEVWVHGLGRWRGLWWSVVVSRQVQTSVDWWWLDSEVVAGFCSRCW